MQRTRAFRRHQAHRHMWRRVKEHWAQDGDPHCFCRTNLKWRGRMKEQPKLCSCWACRNRRQTEGPTIQEQRGSDPRQQAGLREGL
jgi:hypothetical protein